MRYRLIATDIDGTMLDDKHDVSPRGRAVIQEFRRRGGVLVLSTARPPRSVRRLYNDLGLTSPVVAYNGALVYDPVQGRTLLHHPIPAATALDVLALIRTVDPALNVGLEMADEWHVDRIDQRLRARIDAGLAAKVPITGDLEAAICSTALGVSKLYFTAPAATRTAFETNLAASGLDEQVTVTSSGVGFVEVLAAGVNKGAALRALAAILGIPMAQTVALGDEENDIPALQAAGLSIAMGNATDQAKLAAGLIAAPNTEDGWAKAIETYILAG